MKNNSTPRLQATAGLPKGRTALLTGLLLAIFLLAGASLNAATITSFATGNWSTGATWVGGTAPVAGDDVIIASGHTVTLTAAVDITTGNLTVTGTIALAGNNLTAGSLAGAGNIGSASGTPLVTVGSNGSSTTYSGIFSGTGARLTKEGAGTLTLSGANTYTGVTTISAGTLSIGAGGTTGAISNSSNVTNNAALIVDRSDAYTYSGVISGTGSMTKQGAGTFTISGANTYTGVTTISAGTLQLGTAAERISNSSALTVAGGATFNLNGFSETVSSLAGAGTVTSGAAGSVTLTHSGNGSTTFSGIIQNGSATSVALTKTGSGTLTLSGANTYTGATTISTGTLSIGNGGTTGSIAGTSVVNNSALIIDRSDAYTYSGVISGTGSMTKQGAGTLTLSGANTYTGSTTISAGTLQLGSANERISNSSALTVAGGATFDLNGFTETVGSLAGAGTVTSSAAGTPTLSAGGDNTSTTFSGIVQNGSATSIALTKQGTGALTLSGANTYSGVTTLSAGTLNINNASAIGTGTFTISGGTIDNTSGGAITLSTNNVQNWNGNFTFSGTHALDLGTGSVALSAARTVTTTANTLTVGGVISGAFTLTKSGVGTLTLTGANTYTGATTISAGTLSIGSGGTTGSIAGASIVNNSALIIDRSDNLTYSGVISGTGSMTKQGAGTFTISGANTYTGVTTISAGTLQLGTAAERISNSSALTVAGGATFNLNGFSETIGSLAGAGTVTSGVAGSVTLTHNGNGSTTFSGLVENGSGTVALIKAGTGTLTLSGVNTYTGITTISAGTLSISADNNLGTAPGSPTAGQLVFTGTTGVLNTTASFTLNANRGISLGASVTGTINTDAGTTLTYGGVAAGAGALTKAGAGTLTLSGVNTYTGATTISGGSIVLGAAGVIADASALTVTGTLDLNGFSETVASLAGAATASITNKALTSDVATLTTSAAHGLSVGASVVITGVDATFDGTYTIVTVPTTTTFTYLKTASNVASTAVSPAGSANAGAVTSGVAGSVTLTHGGNSSTTFSGVIQNGSGTVALTKAGTGILTLTGANTYTGATTISAGTLSIGSNTTTGSIVSDVTNNGTLTFNRSDAYTYSGIISGTGAVTKTGGTLTLSGANTYGGGTTITAGTLQLGAANTLPGTTAVTFSVASSSLNLNGFDQAVLSISGTIASSTVTNSGAVAATLTVNNSAAATFAGIIQDGTSTVALTKVGTGQLNLTGVNTYTGATTISAGTLSIGNNTTTGSIVSDVTNNATLIFNHSNNYTYGGIISGTGAVTKSGAGILTLTGSNTYTGITTISAGTLSISADNNLGTAPGSPTAGQLVFTGTSTLNTTASFTLNANRGITLATSTINTDAGTTLTYGGVMAGTILTKQGTGTLNLSGANTYSGATTISAGTLQLGAAGVIPDASALTVTGTLDLNGFSETVASLAGAGSVTSSVSGSATLSLGANSSTTFSGIIQNGSGTVALTKAGTGILTLTGANTYTGATTISAGTLSIGSNTTTGSIVSDVTNNATLIFNRSNNYSYDGIISGTGTVTKSGAGILILTGSNTYTGITTISAGTLSISADNNLGTAPGSPTAGRLVFTGTSTLNTTASFTLNANRGITLATSTINTDAGTTLTYGGVMAGVGSLVKQGTGQLTLSGANTYTGATTISAGTLQLGASEVIPNASALTVTGTLDLNGFNETVSSLTGAGTVTSGVPGLATLTHGGNGSTTFSGIIQNGSGTVALTKAGTGTLTLTNTNTYTGITTISAGTLSISADDNLGTAPASPTTGQLVFNGGTLATTANLTLSANRGITLGSSGGTINTAVSTTLTYGGSIDGTGALSKATGTGTLTLSGAGTYTGNTSISSGTLIAANATALGSSVLVTVSSTGTLQTDVSLTLNRFTISATTAKVNLNGNNSTATRLTLGTTTQVNGTYGSTASAATTQNDSYFTSTSAGVLTNNDCPLTLEVVTTIPNQVLTLGINGTVNATVFWGDALSDAYTIAGNRSHTYATPGTYTVSIIGTMTTFGTTSANANAVAITRMVDWGCTDLTSLSGAFWGATNLTDMPNNIPATVTSLQNTFNGATSFNDPDVVSWNTVAVTSMSGMFAGAIAFEQNLGAWNIANVTTMSNMFQNVCLSTTNYEGILNGWEAQPGRKSNVPFHGGFSSYTSAGTAARAALTGTTGWTITDGGLDTDLYLTSSPGTDNQTVGQNASMTPITYNFPGTAGVTISGLPPGVTGTVSGGVLTISGIPTQLGAFNYTIGCTTITGAIEVNCSVVPTATSLCINTALSTVITQTTPTVTGISNDGVSGANGLPPGVSATWASNTTITISGTPTESGIFSYSIPLTGGCGPVDATGTITVIPATTVSDPSSTPTLCINTALTDITHTTTEAYHIGTPTGLPAGVTAVFDGNTITISGTPTESGTFNYSIPVNPLQDQVFTTPGVYSFIVPNNVSNIQAVVVGGGGGGATSTGANSGGGGAGGSLRYSTNMMVVPGQTLTVYVGAGGAGGGTNGYGGWGGNSSIARGGTTLLWAQGGQEGVNYIQEAFGGGGSPFSNFVGGGNGGNGRAPWPNSHSWRNRAGAGGGGAGGYSGNGGAGGGNSSWNDDPGQNGTGGGGGGGGRFGGAGGGVGLYGEGASGLGGGWIDGAPGQGGSNGGAGTSYVSGGSYGGGGGGGGNGGSRSFGGGGGVRIKWITGCDSVNATGTITVLPDAAIASVTGTSQLCINGTATYTADSVVLGGGTGAWSSSDEAVTTVDQNGLVTAVAAGTANIIYTITGGCNFDPVSAQQEVVVSTNTVITSVTGTSPLCIGGTATYMADGVVLGGGTGAWSSSDEAVATVDQDGLVMAVAAGTANIIYTITGGCNGTLSAQQSLTVSNSNDNTAGAASSTPTLCINTALTNITHATTGATGIGTASNLPAGVSAAWAADVITISGTPTASGTFNYSIPLTGGCGTVNATGTITVNPCINFSGKLKYSRDLSTGVGNGTVTLRNTTNNTVLDSELTPADGLYALTATNIASGSFSVKPVKNVSVTNGLSSADAFRINQHVSGSNRFTDPFDLVAADVNRNSIVSSQDAALVNGVVLGNPLALLQFNTSWRFIPETHTLPTNPTGPPLFPVPAGFWSFPEQLNYTGINSDQINQDFVGIKLGDVALSNANPANRGLNLLVWKVEDQELAIGTDILVSFNAEGFSDLAALQFALGFNTGYLEYKGVQMDARVPLNQSNFGAYNAASGELRTSWYSSTGAARSVRNGVSVFQLQFRVLKDGAKLSDVLYLDTNLLLAEAYSEELVPRGIMLEFIQSSRPRDISAETTVTAQDRLLQNQPNPFGNATQIDFELGEACESVLSVYDASGRLLWEDRAYREAGRHSVTYRSAEGQAPGILYYTLRTPGVTLTQKMIMVRQE